MRERETLQRIWRRACIVLSSVSTATGEYQLGIQHADDAWSAEPFDEVACQALMRAHAAAGNRAEALRVFARCRRLFRDELGAEPRPDDRNVPHHPSIEKLMRGLEELLALFLAAVALASAARRFGAPYPVFLALGGAVLAFVPGAPSFTVPPELALALFVAPSCSMPRSMPRCETSATTGRRSPASSSVPWD